MAEEVQEILWHEWGPHAFALAKRSDKPILLSISAKWCHWCHVMDDTTFEDPDVASMINSSFIPVRIDTDERPDVNAKYNMGGWPTVAFLSPDGELIYGLTYAPADSLVGIMIRVLEAYPSLVDELTRTHHHEESKKSLINSSEKLEKQQLDALVTTTVEWLETNFDRSYGGIGVEPKFPHQPVLDFCLAMVQQRGSKVCKEFLNKTLTAMAQGEIYDKEEEGFFRYATMRDWSMPHYEKMLEDNALLMSVYIRAYQVTKKKLFRYIAEGIFQFISTRLYRQGGGFFGSLDANEQYYQLRMADRVKSAQPEIDDTIYTDWNGMAVSALLDAYQVLGEERFLSMACDTLQFLETYLRSPTGGFNHYYQDGLGYVPGLLRDHVWVLACYMKLYNLSNADEWKVKASQLLEFIMQHFHDESGGFFEKVYAKEDIGLVAKREKPGLENALMIDLLYQAATLFAEPNFLRTADRTMAMILANQSQPFTPALAKAALIHLQAPSSKLQTPKKSQDSNPKRLIS